VQQHQRTPAPRLAASQLHTVAPGESINAHTVFDRSHLGQTLGATPETPSGVRPATQRSECRPDRRFVAAVPIAIGHAPGAPTAWAPPGRWGRPGGVCLWAVSCYRAAPAR
jgi:hypothetical protein